MWHFQSMFVGLLHLLFCNYCRQYTDISKTNIPHIETQRRIWANLYKLFLVYLYLRQDFLLWLWLMSSWQSIISVQLLLPAFIWFCNYHMRILKAGLLHIWSICVSVGVQVDFLYIWWEFQYQGCKLWSLLNSWGYQTRNIHIYIYIYMMINLSRTSCNLATSRNRGMFGSIQRFWGKPPWFHDALNVRCDHQY